MADCAIEVLDPASEVILEFGHPGMCCLTCLTSLSRSDRCGCGSNSTISCPICSARLPNDPPQRKPQTGVNCHARASGMKIWLKAIGMHDIDPLAALQAAG